MSSQRSSRVTSQAVTRSLMPYRLTALTGHFGSLEPEPPVLEPKPLVCGTIRIRPAATRADPDADRSRRRLRVLRRRQPSTRPRGAVRELHPRPRPRRLGTCVTSPESPTRTVSTNCSRPSRTARPIAKRRIARVRGAQAQLLARGPAHEHRRRRPGVLVRIVSPAAIS